MLIPEVNIDMIFEQCIDCGLSDLGEPNAYVVTLPNCCQKKGRKSDHSYRKGMSGIGR